MPTRDVLLVTASIVQALEALLLAIVLASLYHTYRRAYQATWALSWLAGTTWILCTQLTLALGPSLPVDHPMRLLASFTAVAGGYLQIALLVVGTLELIERQDSPLAQHRRLLFWS